MIDKLKEYKKIIAIECLNIRSNPKVEYDFEVKFEQINPHRIFKYVLTKTRD